MKLIELIIDEEKDGVDAISIVENPAIESNFVALNADEVKEESKHTFAAVDSDKKILMGAILIPDKPIYRRNENDEFYIYFSKDTVRKASELFLKSGKQNNGTLEHLESINGVSIVESWIVEDTEKDKTALYGIDAPIGSWVGTMKVYNEEIWKDYVKTGKVKGFSLEGYFTDKIEQAQELSNQEKEKTYTEEEVINLLKEIFK